jgi:hypothetical protein
MSSRSAGPMAQSSMTQRQIAAPQDSHPKHLGQHLKQMQIWLLVRGDHVAQSSRKEHSWEAGQETGQAADAS